MGIGIARPPQAIRLRGIATALALALLGPAPLRAAGEPATVPRLSPNCVVPAGDIASAAPLPNLANLLQDRKKIRVLAIGSSSTAGLGASSPSHSYPAQLETILEQAYKGLDVVIVNRGVSGEAAARTAERLKTQVALEHPDLVLWQVGTNDALARVPVADFVATVRDTLQWLKAHKIDTVLVGLQYARSVALDEHYTAIRAALRDLAASENVLLVRRYEAMRFIEQADEGELLSSDDLHLNDLGYRCMAEHIAHAVVVSAFLRGKPAPPKP